MTLFLHEIKRNKISLIVWSAVLSFMLSVCVFIYPEMQTQMGDIGAMFSDMGAFSDAFGMDQLNFGEFMGYFGIECANTLGIGGALLAAIVGIGALAKEERDGTSEFLLTLPISRVRVVSEKLLFSAFHIVAVNAAVILITSVSIVAIDVEVNVGQLALIFLTHLLMQLEIMAITFGISAYIKRGGLGIGLGIAFGFYFVNIVANLTDALEFLSYLTPFGYADSGYILENSSVEPISLIIGLALSALGIFAAYKIYTEKDIA